MHALHAKMENLYIIVDVLINVLTEQYYWELLAHHVKDVLRAKEELIFAQVAVGLLTYMKTRALLNALLIFMFIKTIFVRDVYLIVKHVLESQIFVQLVIAV